MARALLKGPKSANLGRWLFFRHARTRSLIGDFGWIALTLLAVASFVFGYLGLADAAPEAHVCDDPDPPRRTDPEPLSLCGGANQVYGALQLFLLDSPSVQNPNLGLTIARFLAPLVAGVATVRAVLAFFSERARLFHVKYFFKDHCVVVGLGSTGSHLVRALDRDGTDVVVIEGDVANPQITGCKERGIPVVVGDASDHVVLKKARISKAAHLVAASGDDGTNVNVIFAAQEGAAQSREKPLEALAHIDDPDLRRVLQARAIELWSRSTVLLECFNVFDDGAATMLEAHPFDDRLAERPVPEVLIVGVGRLGQALATQAAQRWHADGSARRRPLGITLMGPDATQHCAALRAQAPGLSEVIALRGEDVHMSAPDLEERALTTVKRDPTIVYVTAAPETDELAPVFALHRRYGEKGVPIVVAVRDDLSGVATTLEKAEMTGLHGVEPVALLSSTLRPELLRRRTREIIAQTRHDQYLRDELGKGRVLGERAALVPWEELSQPFKNSNREFADGIGATIEDVGCKLVPRPLMARPDSFSFSQDKLEELAEAEHERWSRAEAARDPNHRSRVPWRDLPEEEREKDREAIRAIPQLLAHAGFEMRRMHRKLPVRRSGPERLANVEDAPAFAEASSGEHPNGSPERLHDATSRRSS